MAAANTSVHRKDNDKNLSEVNEADHGLMWSIENVCYWLKQIGLEKYCGAFRANRVNEFSLLSENGNVDLLSELISDVNDRPAFIRARQEYIESVNTLGIENANVSTVIPDSMKNEELQFLEPKIRKIFLSHDADMDGYLNLNEFITFLQHHLNLTLDESQIHQIFNDMDKKKIGKLEFQNFFQYLSNLIKGDDAEIISASRQLQQQEQQPISAAAKAKFDLFVALLNADKEGKCRLGGITQFMNKKWSTFNNYIRYGQSGQVVMTGSDNIDDILPGEYSLVDLSCWKDNLTEMIKPLHVKIPNVRWLSSPDKKPGLLIFPANFNRSIPTDIATAQNLKYYGCAFANDNQLKVSLLHRHGTWDFTYMNSYKKDYVEGVNGPGLERHGFAHLDCPHAHHTRSGRFILGKFSEEDESELHLTAFIIPTQHTLYIPPYTIHSNDYLQGRWRTMLSDADIDRVLLTCERDVGNLEPFSFHFP
ncbi:unnamed protein product, partial [Didymodactylos carnosus]